MCWYYHQALDVALEFNLPWYIKPEFTIDALATHIPGGLLDFGEEEYKDEAKRELVAFWYLHLSYNDEQIGRFLPGR